MSWYELLIKGPEDDLEGLFAQHPGEVLRGSELKLEEVSVTARILDFLHANTHHLVFASRDQARNLVQALTGHPTLRLDGVWEVASGRFDFEARAFNEEVARRIHDALNGDLPEGVTVQDHEAEERNPDAKGVEMFAPAHEYVYHCGGTVTGTPPGIFEIHQRLARLDFVHEEPLELELREVSGEAPGVG